MLSALGHIVLSMIIAVESVILWYDCYGNASVFTKGPGMSESESHASASDGDLVPEQGTTSTTSNNAHNFGKHARKLFRLKVETIRLFCHLEQKHTIECNWATKQEMLAGDVKLKWLQQVLLGHFVLGFKLSLEITSQVKYFHLFSVTVLFYNF